MIQKVVLFVAFFCIVFSVWCFSSNFSQKKEKTSWLYHLPQGKKEHPFVVVICSFNNENYLKKNLNSVFEQDYSNYRIIYTEDASTDRTKEKAIDWIQKNQFQERTTFISNPTNRGALENLYRAIHLCRDDEIVVFLDGDDWFSHDKVLDWLNRAYQDENVWMTYGSYLFYPFYRKGESKKIGKSVHIKHQYRKAMEKKFLTSHLKTGYAGLFKRVKLEDLVKGGEFFPTDSDLALMVPALEMATEHARYVRDVLYINNRDNPLNDDKKDLKLQQAYRKYILALSPYQPLSSWEREDPKIDVLIKATQGPMQLLVTIESIERFVQGINQICILGETYKDIFPQYKVGNEGEIEKKLEGDYFLIADDTQVFSRYLDIKQCARRCRDTGCNTLFLEKVPLSDPLRYSQEIEAGFSEEIGRVALVHKNCSEKIKEKKMVLVLSEECTQTFFLSDEEKLLTKFNEGLKINLQALLQGSHDDSEKTPFFIYR